MSYQEQEMLNAMTRERAEERLRQERRQQNFVGYAGWALLALRIAVDLIAAVL